MAEKLTMIDFFCGMGNFRAGFEKAGFECVYSVEWDKHKRKIYEVIYGKEPEGGDIRAIHADELPNADVWCFGAPCQDFSIAGKRRGLDGDRSSLVREIFRLLEEKDPSDRPEWIVYENVKGMLSSNNGWDFAVIQAEMGEAGYDVEWQLLNSKDYGVPQNRERVYTVGHFRGRGRRKIFPLGENSTKTVELQGLKAGEPCGGGGGRETVESERASQVANTLAGKCYVRKSNGTYPAYGIYTEQSDKFHRGG